MSRNPRLSGEWDAGLFERVYGGLSELLLFVGVTLLGFGAGHFLALLGYWETAAEGYALLLTGAVFLLGAVLTFLVGALFTAFELDDNNKRLKNIIDEYDVALAIERGDDLESIREYFAARGREDRAEELLEERGAAMMERDVESIDWGDEDHSRFIADSPKSYQGLLRNRAQRLRNVGFSLRSISDTIGMSPGWVAENTDAPESNEGGSE